MDVSTLAAALALVKKIPGSAAERAETAAGNAESYAEDAADAAERAELYGQAISIEDDTIVIGEDE